MDTEDERVEWERGIGYNYLEVPEPNLPICVCETEDMIYEWLAPPRCLGDSKNVYKQFLNDF